MMTKVKDIIAWLDNVAAESLQESFDNTGLQLGDPDAEVKGVLIAVDVTEAVLQEAVEKNCNVVVTHHPLLFHALKRISNKTYIERCVRYAIKHDLSLIAAHTNLDNADGGVNHHFAHLLGLKHVKVLEPVDHLNYKVIIYVPTDHAEALRRALMEVGIGTQGDYSGCSFNVGGEGRFMALEGAHPFVGNEGEWHKEPEVAIFTMCTSYQLRQLNRIIAEVHPYEEPVVDVIPLHNIDNPMVGSGIIGDLDEPIAVEMLFERMKSFMPIKQFSCSKFLKDKVQRIAFCGGSGAFLRKNAARAGADIFITGEAKYNDYYDAVDDVTLVTIGHYESEELTKSLLHDILSRKFSNFAIHNSLCCVNPINYYR